MSAGLEYGDREKAILSALSEDSRAGIGDLASRARCSAITAKRILVRLTNDLDIRFTVELDDKVLRGMERKLVAVTFSKRPSAEALRGFFDKDPHSQNVYMTEGGFDLLVYSMSNSLESYIEWENELASSLSKYGPFLKPSQYVGARHGFMPVSDAAIDAIGPEHRLDERDRTILKLLNSNSRMSYRELSKASGMNEDTVRYRMSCLKREGTIRRYTIAIQNVPETYAPTAYFANYRLDVPAGKGAPDAVMKCISAASPKSPLLDGPQMVAPVSGSFRSFGIALHDAKKTVHPNVNVKGAKPRNGLELNCASIKETIKGLKPFRSIGYVGD